MSRDLTKLQPLHFALLQQVAQRDSKLADALTQFSSVVSEILKEFTVDVSGFFKADVKGIGIRYFSQTPTPGMTKNEVLFWTDTAQKAGLLFYDGVNYFHMLRGDGGLYTPTLTNVVNLDGSTAYQCQYMRLGNMVAVSGKLDANPTAAASTKIGISLPIASNFAAAEDCAGCAFCSTVANQGAAILADATNNRAQMEWIAVDLTNQPMYFSFQYRVI